ncbi:MAG TPA: primosomal protein N', partial [Bdellovibrionota bacterium]|nr:primosomal protein N' [Bdellovibrionota bacterium]
MARFVEVAFPLPLDSTFTYDVPDEAGSVTVGQRVLVPFRHRSMTGYVVALPPSAGEVKTKSIEAILDDIPILTPSLMALARKMAKHYGVSLGETIQTMLPPGLIRQTRRRLAATDQEGEPTDLEARRWLARIRKSRGLDWVATIRRNPAATRTLRKLERDGWIRIESFLRPERARVKKRTSEAAYDATFVNAPPVVLSRPQTAAAERIYSALEKGQHEKFLLHGITGSGKTEIYLQAAQKALGQGKTVLALVPEISLTPQFVGRFRARFGERIAVLHSGRSESERLAEWKRIRRGEATVVVGARSAVFAPLEKIGLFVIDEEHDSSYKQEEGLLYHARELIRERSETERGILLYGSATPSLETFKAAHRGEVELLTLPHRVTGHDLPLVRIVDLRGELPRFGEKGFFSTPLREAIAQTLERDEQVVLFLNRRGFAPCVLCPSCGEHLRCSNCSVSLTYHEREKTYLCHHCGQSQPSDIPCPKCGQGKLFPLGVGTERVERELHHFFPDARIARMDRDAVKKRGKHESILRSLALRETDILIGTQMVTKGLDLAHVTLVGVLLADQSLHFPDFRAAERTFQLLTQVVGRSGRGARRGEAVIQTFQPEHYAIVAAAAQDYAEFYRQEIEYRRQLRYPPFSSMVLLELEGKEAESVRMAAEWLGRQARLADRR